MTHQRQALEPPEQDERSLSLMMRCVPCDALRVFRVEAALGSLMTRQTQHVMVSTYCEHCGTRIAVALFWDKLP